MRDFVRNNNLLYNPDHEQDSCGVGFVADISGSPSHKIVRYAIEAVVKLTHRGAIDADAKTGDGAGILTQIPLKLIKKELAKLGCDNVEAKGLGVGVIFLPSNDPIAKERCKTIVEEVISAVDLDFHGWRKVPVDSTVLGDKALATMPQIYHVFIGRNADIDDDEFERSLYFMRKKIERHVVRNKIQDFYIPSMSCRTIVYKGLLVAPQLRRFYLDLKDPDFESSMALFHQRYSTNTFPNWFLAQPFRMLAHNGEINTLKGNQNWMKAREPELHSDLWKEKINKLFPIIPKGGSDSSDLDNALELLVRSGRDIRHSMMMLIPEAYENMQYMNPDLKGFYEYHSCLTEPWGGPASVAFCDGKIIGAALDRNGLRPARYVVTEDNIVIMGSEIGVVEIDESKVVEKGRLGPGKIIAVDTEKGVLLKNDEIKEYVSRRKPYADWVEQNMFHTEKLGHISSWSDVGEMDELELLTTQKAFGYSLEDYERIIEPMATKATEPVGSMGDDTPLSVLSERPRLLYTYFKQRFAQVTNPPIDSIRENIVMSLATSIGHRKSMLEETSDHAKLIKFPSPILTNEELKWLRHQNDPEFRCAELSMTFRAEGGPEAMEEDLKKLCQTASEAIDENRAVLILSDRDINKQKAPIPALLAVSAIHHYLIREGKRMKATIIVESGEPREDHHFACLLGYGASCINPFLAYESVAHIANHSDELSVPKALENYRKAAEKGIFKIMSKMGISTVASYRGAQIFEAVGISKPVTEEYFTGTESRIEGVDLATIARDVLRFHSFAYEGDLKKLKEKGYFRFRKSGEYHSYNPAVFKSLRKVAKSGDYEDFKKFSSAVDATPLIGIRDLLEFKKGAPIPIDEVEPIESIVRRFVAPGMSYGALSKEAHETIAIGMNRVGAKTCSGEGGESPERFHRKPNGDWANSLIKQVASGRFGVTPEYLASAKEIEIKMAQGSKPGEGGQLPGAKVTEEIARVRHSTPGVTLISPPPHHDIYSIEDLAQLIYDLKHSNTRAKVAVKLVSEAGVGTVAAGVAKGNADVIHISGHEGGTGASPLGSMKHAGISWEMGLSEAQQVLVLNDLRGRVILRSDGGLKTGKDVLVAAMLGAEEYAFGTANLIAVGCVMARQCHLNTCPVGVATQKPHLRAKFPGTPENVVNYMTGIAMEIREKLAELGFRKMDEIIGRTDLLKQKDDIEFPKTANIDLSAVLGDPDPGGTRTRIHTIERNDRVDAPLDNLILQEAMDSIAGIQSVKLNYEINNTNRTVGAMLAGEIAYRYGDKGLPGVTIEINFKGTAGQSFGAFSLNGMILILEGDANDYVGKSMHGGEIIIKPPRESKYVSHENVIIGNTVMYGATGGILYAAGCAGERFCVRNSGGHAVIEGVGDHGCEYMTGGIVVVMGEAGRNFAAGMTGGLAYVLDEDGTFPLKYNPQHVGIDRLTEKEDIDTLKSMILKHREKTGSERSKDILQRWDHYLPLFWKALPFEMAKIIEEKKKLESAQGVDMPAEAAEPGSMPESEIPDVKH